MSVPPLTPLSARAAPIVAAVRQVPASSAAVSRRKALFPQSAATAACPRVERGVTCRWDTGATGAVAPGSGVFSLARGRSGLGSVVMPLIPKFRRSAPSPTGFPDFVHPRQWRLDAKPGVAVQYCRIVGKGPIVRRKSSPLKA